VPPPFTAMFVAPFPMVVALLTLLLTPVDMAKRFVKFRVFKGRSVTVLLLTTVPRAELAV